MSDPVMTRALTRRFGDRTALDGLDLRVEKGQFFALLGPNGGGKSTTFRILSTLLPPTEGEAQVFGFDVVRQQDEVRERIGVVFQKPSLDEKLRVGENLLYQGRLYGLRGQELKKRVDELLDRFAIRDRVQDVVKTLSGGLQRRVEIAKGMIHRPELLLLDEPSTGLDPAARRELREQLERARDEEGVTVVMTTHILDEAEHCDAVTVLDRGRVVASGSPDSLKDEISGDVVRIDVQDPETLAAEVREHFDLDPKLLPGALQFQSGQAYELARKLDEHFGDRVRGVAISRPTLEDVFLVKTGHVYSSDESGEDAR